MKLSIHSSNLILCLEESKESQMSEHTVSIHYTTFSWNNKTTALINNIIKLMKDNGSGLDATFLPHNPKILPAIQKHTYWIQKPYIQNSKYCTVGEITVQASISPQQYRNRLGRRDNVQAITLHIIQYINCMSMS